MWAFFDGDATDGSQPVPVGGVMEGSAIHALIADVCPASLSVDGVVPMPGCDPPAGGHARYWLTGRVGQDVRELRERRRFRKRSYQFLLRVDDMRFVGNLIASRRFKLRPGSRLTVKCVFRVPQGWEGDADLPEEWCSDWEVLAIHEPQHERGYMLNVERPLADDGGAAAADRHRRTPLLLDTDYGGGPLWYRRPDDKGPWALDLSYFSLSEALRDRLVRWAAADYHTHYDYEDDNPEHEVAWHNEGLDLLVELRRELGPNYDIKFSHDLTA